MKYLLLSLIAAVMVTLPVLAAPTYTSFGTGDFLDCPDVAAGGAVANLDYTPMLESIDCHGPYATVEMLFLFDSDVVFNTLNIQAMSDGSIVQLFPNAGGGRQISLQFLTPAYPFSGDGDVPRMVMPQSWVDELADGVFSANVWIDGAAAAPQYALFNCMPMFEIPEPATVGLLSLGALALRRRRRS